MLKGIRMPLIVKGLCGATIGFLLGLYIANTFFSSAIVVLLCMASGAAVGIWLLRR